MIVKSRAFDQFILNELDLRGTLPDDAEEEGGVAEQD